MGIMLDHLESDLSVAATSVKPKRRRRKRPTAEHLAALARQTRKIKAFKAALVAAGYETARAQADVLGLSRSTAWSALNAEHKRSGFSSKTIKRMLLSPELPPAIRRMIEEYVKEKLDGLYGQNKRNLGVFRRRIGARKKRG